MEERIKQMEIFLSQERPTFIFHTDFIDAETFNKLRQIYRECKLKTKFKECFEKVTENNTTFNFEYKCIECGNNYKLKDSKTKLFYYIESDETKLKCYDCVLKEHYEQEQKAKEILKNYEKEKEKIKNDYFQSYMNPECSLVKDAYKRLWQVKNEVINFINYIGKDEVKKYANSMDYLDYLKTPYWKLVSSLVKRKAYFKCQLCGSEYDLNVHHRSYKNKGIEIMHMEDLIVLCYDCHQKFHDIGEHNE